MESKLRSCILCAIILATFNRTSMESKQPFLVSTHSTIQPFNRTSMESKLIKPCALKTRLNSAFNRTSMESKLTDWNSNCRIVSEMAFNRTSMESKLSNGVCPNTLMALLIEPVWNRNLVNVPIDPTSLLTLLIEPVWNRNKIQDSQQTRYAFLLIEPVWNRNNINSGFRGFSFHF